MVNCEEIRKNINLFLKNKLNSNDVRKFYYHIKHCKKCYEQLLDEYTFFVTFNDLDDDFHFNYEKSLNEKLEKIENNFETNDNKKIFDYTLYSLLILFFLFFVLIISIRVVYK